MCHQIVVPIFANKTQTMVAILILCLLVVVEPPAVTIVLISVFADAMPAVMLIETLRIANNH